MVAAAWPTSLLTEPKSVDGSGASETLRIRNSINIIYPSNMSVEEKYDHLNR